MSWSSGIGIPGRVAMAGISGAIKRHVIGHFLIVSVILDELRLFRLSMAVFSLDLS
jgi:hypothetical protein